MTQTNCIKRMSAFKDSLFRPETLPYCHDFDGQTWLARVEKVGPKRLKLLDFPEFSHVNLDVRPCWSSGSSRPSGLSRPGRGGAPSRWWAAIGAWGFYARRQRSRVAAVPLAELLGPELAKDWDELHIEGMRVVAADLSDIERCMQIVAPVFNVKMDDLSEVESVKKGIAGRLGARRSLVGLDAASPRPLLSRPAPHGSAERPELGLVLALEDTETLDAFVALVDLSLWPDDGRVRAPNATSKPRVPSKPYILNLCVDPNFRRKGLARRLMNISERLIRDIWGDTEIYLHVEDDQVAANYLYEAIGYVPLKYTQFGMFNVSFVIFQFFHITVYMTVMSFFQIFSLFSVLLGSLNRATVSPFVV